ncbi:M15 family metallopeptidase [Miniphocaeibacter massiliensis]|uniref:M15 family metallopeptidase n=1 Tax=Miniphocaeibacter massiliensis TaxID=2041841 RepID=UPI000C1C7824|nr:M15 family metallopeptidase [Miniphocaeibacter massiliensis]
MKKRKRLRGIIIFISTIVVLGIVFFILNVVRSRFSNPFEDYSYYENISYNEADYPVCRDINELEPETKRLCEKFLKACEKEGLPVMIIETYRSQERQDYLYSQGRTREGSQVTWTKKSYHTSRKAFDIAKNEAGNMFGDEEFFRRCAEIGESIGLEAGYFWKEYQDKGHFES